MALPASWSQPWRESVLNFLCSNHRWTPAFWPGASGWNWRNGTDPDESHPQLPCCQVQLAWEGFEGKSQVPECLCLYLVFCGPVPTETLLRCSLSAWMEGRRPGNKGRCSRYTTMPYEYSEHLLWVSPSTPHHHLHSAFFNSPPPPNKGCSHKMT